MNHNIEAFGVLSDMFTSQVSFFSPFTCQMRRSGLREVQCVEWIGLSAQTKLGITGFHTVVGAIHSMNRA